MAGYVSEYLKRPLRTEAEVMAERCPKCRGLKFVPHLSPHSARLITKPCPACKGTGKLKSGEDRG